MITTWHRDNLSVDSATGGINAYVCPIPKSMGNCFNQNTIETQGQSDQRIKWTDNLVIASQPFYQKTAIFGSSESARNSPEATHMGGVLKWRLENDEPSFSTYSIFLPTSASQIGYVDEKNEKLQYLVVVNNGVSADLENVNLSLLVNDYYKMTV